MHACVTTLAVLLEKWLTYVILIFISGEDLVTNTAVCHDKIVNQQFAACSGLPPQCSTFSSSNYKEAIDIQPGTIVHLPVEIHVGD